MFARLLCLINRHRPVRAEVRWNGTHYVASCRHCGSPIQRQNKGGWRAIPAAD